MLAYNYFNVDMCEAPPRAVRWPWLPVFKRILPDNFVFTYQGDGDLAAIGAAETIHAANRGENITTIFINNAIYGMTGGQMAPTTTIGLAATTTPGGRVASRDGNPLDISRMLATSDGVVYVERCVADFIQERPPGQEGDSQGGAGPDGQTRVFPCGVACPLARPIGK